MDLAEGSALFAADVEATINGVLPTTTRMTSRHVEESTRFLVQPEGATPAARRIPLSVDGEHLADLNVTFYMDQDRSGTYLKAVRSDLGLRSTLDRTPLLRLEHRSDMRTDPVSHWQFHAERGSFSHLLARAHHHRPNRVAAPHDLSSLHLPVGGERFRPCLEDFLQLLVQDCGVDAREGWEDVLTSGRRMWRRRQVGAVVRDSPVQAARVLAELGWSVTAPPSPSSEDPAALGRW